MEYDFLLYANDVISRGAIPELKVLWKKSVGLASVGRIVRDSITSNLDEIAGINGYSLKFVSFRELLLHHEDYTSPLRKMCINNEYILISRDQRIPFSPARFFKLLKKTKLRGLRVVFECNNGNIFSLEEKVSFLLRREGNKLTIIEFQTEYYEHSFRHYYFVPTSENSAVRDTKGTFDDILQTLPGLDISHYFDEAAELTDRLGKETRIYPAFQQGSVEKLVLDSVEKGESFAVFGGVDKQGEYIFTGEDNCMNYLYGQSKNGFFDLYYLNVWKDKGIFLLRQFEKCTLDLKGIPEDLRSENILLSIIGQIVTSNTISHYPEMEFKDKSIVFPNIDSYCHDVEEGNLCLVTYSKIETIITSEAGVDYKAVLVGIVDELYVYELYKE